VSRDQRLVALTECMNRRRTRLWITRVEQRNPLTDLQIAGQLWANVNISVIDASFILLREVHRQATTVACGWG
jgi:hypothetical protein